MIEKNYINLEQEYLRYMRFTKSQAELIKKASEKLTLLGGPDAEGVAKYAEEYGQQLKATLTDEQLKILEDYSTGKAVAIMFKGLKELINDATMPDFLPSPLELSKCKYVIELASRNQILLTLIDNKAFAYDIDNNGKLIRVVANFQGGGKNKIQQEKDSQVISLSSHAGVALGAHTEAPYHATKSSVGSHSPAPSTLILTARWNPQNETTSVIPLPALMEKIDSRAILGLTLKEFGFTRTDSFVEGKGEGVNNSSIIDLDKDGMVRIRFNIYRTYYEQTAPEIAREGFVSLVRAINTTMPIKVNLQPTTAIAINNSAALHGRDIIMDNRRLLIRLFGYEKGVEPIKIATDPMIVQG